MKRFKYNILLSIITLTAFIGCKEHQMITYSDGSGIYFSGNQMNDSVGVSWAYRHGDMVEMNHIVTVMVFGKPVNYDRPFSIELIDELVSSEQAKVDEDYKSFPLDYIMPANAISLDIVIPIIRNPKLTEGGRRILSFKLLENENFKFLYNRYYDDAQRVVTEGDTVTYTRYIDTYRSIIQTEYVYRQHWWSLEGEGHQDFGVWSTKKSLFICDFFNIDRELWLSGNQIGNITDSYMAFYGKKLHRYLQDNPQYESDGVTLMEMGPRAKL